LLGTIYRKGDITFSKDGYSVYVPVGNKITQYDLRNDRASTLPVEVGGNFTSLALSPNGLILIGATDCEFIWYTFRILMVVGVRY
jgi:periodic tryptophan protein 2